MYRTIRIVEGEDCETIYQNARCEVVEGRVLVYKRYRKPTAAENIEAVDEALVGIHPLSEISRMESKAMTLTQEDEGLRWVNNADQEILDVEEDA